MNLPLSFIQHTKSLLADQWIPFEKALNELPPVSIRLNPVKAHNKAFSIEDIEPVLWSQYGYYLPKRPSFTFDPLFHAGVYYVQEASSMFLEQVFRQYVDASVCVLDLCAAPGGKSTHIASLIDSGSMLVSNEVIPSRAHILLDNVLKSGYENVVVTNNQPAAFGGLGATFDVVVVDAPCSGEGMFRKDEGAVGEWSENNVRICTERQQTILEDVWPALCEGGLLIYSTCTYNLHEDEENVAWMANHLGAEVLPLEVGSDWGITRSLSADIDLAVNRFLPHRTKGEGFFLAVLRKTSEGISPKSSGKKGKTQKTKPAPQPVGLKELILDSDNFSFHEINGKWRAYSPQVASFLEQAEGLKILNAGILLGEQKGKDLVVSHALALSLKLNSQAFPLENVDKETAIKFLKKEPFSLSCAEKGYVLLAFEGTPIGFVKNMGNRANNLLPNEWRIRKADEPADNFRWLQDRNSV